MRTIKPLCFDSLDKTNVAMYLVQPIIATDEIFAVTNALINTNLFRPLFFYSKTPKADSGDVVIVHACAPYSRMEVLSDL